MGVEVRDGSHCAKIKVLADTHSFLEAPGQNKHPCLFQLLKVTHISRLLAPASIFKACDGQSRLSHNAISQMASSECQVWILCLSHPQFCSSVAQLCPALSDPMDCSIPDFMFFTLSQSLLRLKSTELVIPSNHLIHCRPLLLLPSVFPSIMVFSNESPLHIRWPKYWSFSFSISLSNKYSGLISFRIDWIYLLAHQRTLKTFLQYHSSKASFL